MNRNSLACELLRIPRTVPPLMVIKRNFLGEAQSLDVAFREKLATEHGVLAHEAALRVLKLLGGMEDLVRNGHLADVVKSRGEIDCEAGLGVHAEVLRQLA